MPLTSMTGFADCGGMVAGVGWAWEARSVNARGLDLRIRLPEGFEGLDAAIRSQAAAVLSRGAVTIGLRIGAGGCTALPRLRPEVLAAVIAATREAEAAAAAAGLDLAPVTAADLVSLRGVMEAEALAPAETPGVRDAVSADVGPLLAALAAARAGEGAALSATITGQLERIAGLVATARDSADGRASHTGALLRTRLEAVLATTDVVDEARLAQELALIAVRADVTEELDRLQAHVVAAHALVVQGGPVGRRLDFLMQEFNREANTLCSKSGSAALTAIGLELKVLIDQMREQVQNVE
jgi:uncharacterized protein (TIGR00255 family)